MTNRKMTAFYKHIIEFALEEAMTLTDKEVPIIDEVRVQDTLLGARRDCIKLEETLNELEKFQTEIRDNTVEWMTHLKKLKGQEAVTEEQAFDQFCSDLDLKAKQRSLGAKVREWKKALKDAQLLIEDALEEKRERLAVQKLLRKEDQTKAMQEAMEAMSTAVQNLNTGGNGVGDPHPDRGFRLPAVQLGKYRGPKDNWTEFWEQFKLAVDSDNKVADVKKLIYLKSLLEGEPIDLIRGLTNEDGNYPIAKDILTGRYGNPDTIIRNLHQELSLLKPCNTFADDNKFAVDMEKLCCQLEAMKEDVNNHQLLITLEKKLSRFTLRKVIDAKNELPLGEKWDVKKFRQTLAAVIKRESEVQQIFTQDHTVKKERQMFTPIRPPARKLTEQTMAFAVKEKNCNLCDNNRHWTANCDKFPDIYSRVEQAKKLKACQRCLNKGHSCRECTIVFKPCYFCTEARHVAALCPQKFGKNVAATLHEEIGEDLYEESPEEYTEEDEPAIMASSQGNEVEGHGTKRLLMSAKAQIFNVNNPEKTVEALFVFDSGCERTFIKEDIAKKLALPEKKVDLLSLSGFSETSLGSHKAPFTNLGFNHYYGSSGLEANIIEKVIGAITIAKADNPKEMESEDWELTSETMKPDVLVGIDQIRKFEIVDRKELPCGFWLSDSIIGPIISGIGFCNPRKPSAETVSLVLSEPFNCPSDEERQQWRIMHSRQLCELLYGCQMKRKEKKALNPKMKGSKFKKEDRTADQPVGHEHEDGTGAEAPDHGPPGWLDDERG